jgi:acyl-coenzyme A thioesterase 13
MGKTLAYTETKIFHPNTGKLLAQGLHTKFVGKSLDHPKNVEFDASGDQVVKGEIVDVD